MTKDKSKDCRVQSYRRIVQSISKRFVSCIYFIRHYLIIFVMKQKKCISFHGKNIFDLFVDMNANNVL